MKLLWGILVLGFCAEITWALTVGYAQSNSINETLPLPSNEPRAAWPPHLRHLQHLHPRDQYPMTIFPPECWYVLHPPDQFEGELKDLGFVPGTTPTITFSTASSTAMRVVVGTIRGKTDNAGTLMFNDTSGVTMWECLLGWTGEPTKAVKLALPQESITKDFLTTDGAAYVTCSSSGFPSRPGLTSSPGGGGSSTASPSPSPLPSPSPMLSSSGPASTAGSSTSSGTSSASISSQTTFWAAHPPSASSPSPSPSPTPSSPSALGLNSNDSSNSAAPMSGGMDNTYEAQVWIHIPEPHVSVHPLDPRVGNWDAAGPFEHLFSFHAWVPTYLEEAFEIFTRSEGSGNWTKVDQCTVGISSKPAGTEMVTFTVTATAPYVTPSGVINGAFMQC